MAFRLSIPIAFDAAITTAEASWATAAGIEQMTRSEARITILTGMANLHVNWRLQEPILLPFGHM